MTNSSRCDRCGQTETTKHLLWDCEEAKRIWDAYNTWIRNQAVTDNNVQVNSYNDIYVVDDNAQACKVKIKVIQEMIQITRPRHWNLENINNIDKDLRGMEKYNKTIKHKLTL